MKFFNRFFFVLFTCFSCASAYAVENIDIKITKANNDWFVHYVTSKPIKQLAFLSSPNSSRIQRWQPLDTNIVIAYENNTEFIRTINGQSFSSVGFKLTPTYTSLPKAYAPFSPFSNGDMLFHSGRFFVCVNECNPTINGWRFTLDVPANEQIIVNGKSFKTQAQWLDVDNGQNIYVGNKAFTESDNFFAIIDEQLPLSINQSLTDYLPKLMTFFNAHLTPLTNKPMLFASYSPTDKQGFDRQGGTLTNQVFMHWDGKNISAHSDQQSTLWFFGHEIAHLFQHNAFSASPTNAWIHEGGADILTSIAMLELTHDYDDFILSKLQAALPNCTKQLSSVENYNAAIKINSRVHYDCGLAIQYEIQSDIKANNPKNSMLNVWYDYVKTLSENNTNNTDNVERLILSAKPYISAQLFQKLMKNVENVENEQFDFYQFFNIQPL